MTGMLFIDFFNFLVFETRNCRFIVQCAAVYDGIIVSCDNFRDLLRESPHLKSTIETKLLMPTWVDNMIIFPSDPLGRDGPSLDRFLRFP